MPCYLCTTCGTQFAETTAPPSHCPICEDERQYVGHGGQRWTTLEALRRDHRNRVEPVEGEALWGIGTEPAFAIGQRALLLRSREGNVLWDCVSLIDDATVEALDALGGVDVVAVSHPHFYASVVAWAEAFGAEVLLHAADREHLMRSGPRVRFWEGDRREIRPGLVLLRAGGHFAGGTVLHWAEGAGGRGALLSGDIVQVAADRRWVSFMYSYPNLIPLPASEVERVAAAVDALPFERIYGAWWDRVVLEDGAGVVRRSAARYRAALEGRLGAGAREGRGAEPPSRGS